MQRDWIKKPFVGISIKPKCDANEEVMFFKEWKGTTSGCVRHNKYGPDWITESTSDSNIHNGRYLQSTGSTSSYSTMNALDIFVYDQGACKRTIWSSPPVIQDRFSGQQICGLRGGQEFLNLKRPDPKLGACPIGTTPCSSKTSVENTICYPPADHALCPITSMKFVIAG